LDAPTAPTIVLERPAPCDDAAKAEELLKRTLAPALAPRAEWKVTARFSRRGASLVVAGEIVDEVGAPVAHRVLNEASLECSSLARAVGVWASLVLDSELERAQRLSPPPPPPPPSEPILSLATEKPAKEASVLLDSPEGQHAVELGVNMSIMGGMGSGVMAGPTLYGVVETGKGWFLMPALYVERTLEEIKDNGDVYGTLVATRFDTCGRISGFHIKRIQLDLCGGAEIGFMHFDESAASEGMTGTSHTLPFFALGPSATLRGELADSLALVLRGVVDLNVVREGFNDTSVNEPSLFLGRAELGLSWALR
jgi:hypothetical protein